MARSTDLSGEHSGQLGLAVEWKPRRNSPKEDGRDPQVPYSDANSF